MDRDPFDELRSDIARLEPLRHIWMNPDVIWSRVDKTDRCWPWMGRRKRGGYGELDIGGGSLLAHRAAFFLANGYLCNIDEICHRCDNPTCCNPEHLFAGSHTDNMADMKAKGRRKGIGKGTDNGRAKLTLASAANIKQERANGDTLKAIARRYGVGISTIARVCSGESWS